MHKKEIEGSLILLLAALLWGLTFIFQSQASQYIGPFTLSAFRNIVATLFLLPVMLFSINPVGTVFLTLVPRILEGWLTALIFQALHKMVKTQKFSYFIASLACPLLNTLLFMSTLVIIFYNTPYIQSFAAKFGTSNPFTFVVAFVGVQGTIEAVVCFAVASILSRALYKILKTTM